MVVVLRVVWGWPGSWVGARRCATPRVLVEADMVVFWAGVGLRGH